MRVTGHSCRFSGRDAGQAGRGKCRALILCALFSTVFLFAGCAGDDPSTASERAPRVIMIGIDGGSWNLLDPMIADGELPHLAALAARGVTADLDSVKPLNSPTVWTSIATGRSPEAHGVTFFYADRTAIQTPTIWERFSAAGLQVGLYEHLVTWPPRDLPGGFMMPGWLRRDASVMPADLEQRLGAAPYAYSMDGVDGLDAIVANAEGEVAQKAATWNRLVETFDLDVGAVVFYSVDAVCHRLWHAAFPDDFDPPVEAADPRYRDVIEQTLRGVDRAIGEIVAALSPEDHVVVVSDHGFGPRERGLRRQWAIQVPALLDHLSVDADGESVSALINFESLVLRLDSAPESGVGSGLNDEREETLRRLEEGLRSLRSLDGEALFEVQIVRSEEPNPEREVSGWMARVLGRAGQNYAVVFARPRVAALDLLWPDGLIELAGKRLALREVIVAHDFSGNHRSKGIFLAAGGAIRHRPGRGQLSVLDVAPLMTYLADQAIPDDLEGLLDQDLIDPAYLTMHPPRRIGAAEAPALPAEGGAAAELPSGDDSELDQRLRTLGYI